MMHSTSSLYDQLRLNLIQIDQQIEVLQENAGQRYNILENRAVSWQELMDEKGAYLATPLLAAKAQVLSAMAALKAADMQQRTKR